MIGGELLGDSVQCKSQQSDFQTAKFSPREHARGSIAPHGNGVGHAGGNALTGAKPRSKWHTVIFGASNDKPSSSFLDGPNTHYSSPDRNGQVQQRNRSSVLAGHNMMGRRHDALPSLLENKHASLETGNGFGLTGHHVDEGNQGHTGAACSSLSASSKQPETPAQSSKSSHSSSAGHPLLEDGHLRILLGEMSSEEMTKAAKAASSMATLWQLTDIDGDGTASYFELKHLFSKWSGRLATDCDRFVYEDERSPECRISYKRFVEIFLPLVMTVSPDAVTAFLNPKKEEPPTGRKSFAARAGDMRNRAKSSMAGGHNPELRTIHSRKSLAVGMNRPATVTGTRDEEDDEEIPVGSLRKRSLFHAPDLAVGAKSDSVQKRKSVTRGERSRSVAGVGVVASGF